MFSLITILNEKNLKFFVKLTNKINFLFKKIKKKLILNIWKMLLWAYTIRTFNILHSTRWFGGKNLKTVVKIKTK